MWNDVWTVTSYVALGITIAYVPFFGLGAIVRHFNKRKIDEAELNRASRLVLDTLQMNNRNLADRIRTLENEVDEWRYLYDDLKREYDDCWKERGDLIAELMILRRDAEKEK